MRAEVIELFFTDDMRIKYHDIKPYKDCKKCEQGLKMESDTICDCSLSTILELIAEIPDRYNVDIKLSKSLKKQVDEIDKFVVITGEDKYAKLLAYYLAKKFIADGKIVRHVATINGYRNDSRIVDDITSMNKADVVIFEDIFKKQAAPEYNYEIKKRVDKNKPIIFLGKTELVVMDDDFLQIEVDSADITVVK